MKKENAVVGFVVMLMIGFAAGRLTAPKASSGGDVPTAVSSKPTDKPESADKGAGGAVEGMKVASADKLQAPVEGAKDPKVVIVEFSDFQ